MASSATRIPVPVGSVPSLFERYQLDKCFPKAKYLEVQKNSNASSQLRNEVTPFIPHFLFALNATLESIKKYFSSKNYSEVKEIINRQASAYKLTCLHITVIQGNVEASRELIQRGADANARDVYGFTPWLHTALLVDSTTLKTLLEERRIERDPAQWAQLRKSAGFEPDTASLEKCFPPTGTEPILIDWTNNFKMELYTDSVIFSPPYHRHLWRLFSQHSFGKIPEMLDAFLNKTLHPPQLSIRNSLGTGVDSDRTNGLYLCDDVQAGDFIGWYGAKAIPLPVEPDLYRWQIQQKMQQKIFAGDFKEDYFALIDESNELTADAYNVGNALRFANDGWPLMICLRFPGQRLGMFTLQSVPKNTELSWNYGVTNIRLKWGNYKLLHKKEMVVFLGNQTLKSLLTKIDHLKEEVRKAPTLQIYITQDCEIDNYEAKIKFIFETPAALIFLCLNNSIKASEVLDLLNFNEKFRKFLQTDLPTHTPHYLWTVQILILLQQIEESLAEISDDKQRINFLIQSFFNDKIIDRYSIPQIVKGVAFLRSYLKNRLRNNDLIEKEWDSFKNETKEKLEQYSLGKDNEPPLAFFTPDQKLIVVLEDGCYDLILKLKSLADVDRASTQTDIVSKTHNWGETYKIRVFKNFRE